MSFTNLLMSGLAVYKLVQITESLLPRHVLPYVKLLFALVLSFGVTFVTPCNNHLLYSLAIATLSGAVHSVLRLITLVGDHASRPTVRRVTNV